MPPSRHAPKEPGAGEAPRHATESPGRGELLPHHCSESPTPCFSFLQGLDGLEACRERPSPGDPEGMRRANSGSHVASVAKSFEPCLEEVAQGSLTQFSPLLRLDSLRTQCQKSFAYSSKPFSQVPDSQPVLLLFGQPLSSFCAQVFRRCGWEVVGPPPCLVQAISCAQPGPAVIESLMEFIGEVTCSLAWMEDSTFQRPSRYRSDSCPIDNPMAMGNRAWQAREADSFTAQVLLVHDLLCAQGKIVFRDGVHNSIRWMLPWEASDIRDKFFVDLMYDPCALFSACGRRRRRLRSNARQILAHRGLVATSSPPATFWMRSPRLGGAYSWQG